MRIPWPVSTLICRGSRPLDLLWGMQRSAINQFIGRHMYLYNSGHNSKFLCNFEISLH